MFLRLVQVKIRPDTSARIPKLYAERIMQPLRKTTGCLFAGLIQSVGSSGEAFSMTLWDTAEHAEAYERSGLFRELLKAAEPYIFDSSEWKIQLSEDLKLEYAPVGEEAVVRSYRVAAASDDRPPDAADADRLYVRLLSIKLQPGKREEFVKIYNSEILPALGTVKDCRYAFLTEGIGDESGVVSLTIWNNKEAADAYESGGLFAGLMDKIRHTLSGLYRWKMAVETSSDLKVHTSDDVQVTGYNVVKGETFH